MTVDVKAILVRPLVPQLLCLTLTLLVIWQFYVGVVPLFSMHQGSLVLQNNAYDHATDPKKGLTLGLSTQLFGDYVPKNLGDAAVKQSMLDLKVVGIMYLGKRGRSHVIISSPGEIEHEFRVGDTLPGGAIIKKITPQGILIRFHGAMESLNLPKDALFFEPPARKLEDSSK
ncbi:MAG: hypothetical protein NTW94_04515 [Legionellales bacterium]|nr:hypothetical protein [Legionellales bacterium]